MELISNINKYAETKMIALNQCCNDMSQDEPNSILGVALRAIAVFSMTIAMYVFEFVEFLSRAKVTKIEMNDDSSTSELEGAASDTDAFSDISELEGAASEIE